MLGAAVPHRFEKERRWRDPPGVDLESGGGRGSPACVNSKGNGDRGDPSLHTLKSGESGVVPPSGVDFEGNGGGGGIWWMGGYLRLRLVINFNT